MQKSSLLAAASLAVRQRITLQKTAFLSLCWRAAKISATAALPATAAVFVSPDVIPENCRW